jgi:hypothetical protein
MNRVGVARKSSSFDQRIDAAICTSSSSSMRAMGTPVCNMSVTAATTGGGFDESVSTMRKESRSSPGLKVGRSELV